MLHLLLLRLLFFWLVRVCNKKLIFKNNKNLKGEDKRKDKQRKTKQNKMEYEFDIDVGETYIATNECGNWLEFKVLKVNKKSVKIEYTYEDKEPWIRRYPKQQFFNEIYLKQQQDENVETCEMCGKLLDTEEELDYIMEVGCNVCKSCNE